MELTSGLPVSSQPNKQQQPHIHVAAATTTAATQRTSYVTCVDEVPSPEDFYHSFVQPRKPVLVRQKCGSILGRPTLRTDLTLQALRTLSKRANNIQDDTSDDADDDDMVEVNERRYLVPVLQPKDLPVPISDPSAPLQPTAGLAVIPKTTSQRIESPRQGTTPVSASFSPAEGSRVCEVRWGDFLDHLTPHGATDNTDDPKMAAAAAVADTTGTASLFYLTTQTLPLDEEGRPAVTTWLADALIARGIVPLRPPVLGHLIPMNAANLWMGRFIHTEGTVPNGGDRSDTAAVSSSSSSSGLHHDYHDNLYCLVRGHKSIRLAPPDAIHNLQMAGTIHTVHANGRIVYHEQIDSIAQTDDNNVPVSDCPIRPDGSLCTVERIVELETRKEKVEQTLEHVTTHGSERARLEQELNDIEEQLLDIEMEENSAPGGNDADESDDANDDESKTGVFFGCAVEKNTDDGDDDTQQSSKRLKLSGQETTTNTTKQEGQARPDGNESDAKEGTTTVPPNFVVAMNEHVEFEMVEMDEGDVLYLPAGWFHEVYSRGKHGSGYSDDLNDGIHLAVNYWVHPPDVGPGTSFATPYRSLFWQRDWVARNLD